MPAPVEPAARRCRDARVPLRIIPGREYDRGPSRDRAANGTLLFGVRAVMTASHERVERSNLVGTGVLPLQFQDGEDAGTLGLGGREVYSLQGLRAGAREVAVLAEREGGEHVRLMMRVRLDTPREWEYCLHGRHPALRASADDRLGLVRSRHTTGREEWA